MGLQLSTPATKVVKDFNALIDQVNEEGKGKSAAELFRLLKEKEDSVEKLKIAIQELRAQPDSQRFFEQVKNYLWLQSVQPSEIVQSMLLNDLGLIKEFGPAFVFQRDLRDYIFIQSQQTPENRRKLLEQITSLTDYNDARQVRDLFEFSPVLADGNSEFSQQLKNAIVRKESLLRPATKEATSGFWQIATFVLAGVVVVAAIALIVVAIVNKNKKKGIESDVAVAKPTEQADIGESRLLL